MRRISFFSLPQKKTTSISGISIRTFRGLTIWMTTCQFRGSFFPYFEDRPRPIHWQRFSSFRRKSHFLRVAWRHSGSTKTHQSISCCVVPDAKVQQTLLLSERRKYRYIDPLPPIHKEEKECVCVYWLTPRYNIKSWNDIRIKWKVWQSFAYKPSCRTTTGQENETAAAAAAAINLCHLCIFMAFPTFAGTGTTHRRRPQLGDAQILN